MNCKLPVGLGTFAQIDPVDADSSQSFLGALSISTRHNLSMIEVWLQDSSNLNVGTYLHTYSLMLFKF